MSKVYLILVTTGADAVWKRVTSTFAKTDRLMIDEDKFVVAFDGTTIDLAEKVGMRSDPHIGSGIVIPVTNYSGRANPDLWEWLSAKLS